VLSFTEKLGTTYRGVQGFFILFDCTDRENSFQRVPKYFEDINEYARDDVPKILVATKIDLANQRQVSFEEAKQLADQLGVPYIETSAKNDINVFEAYHILARDVERSFEKKVTSVPNLALDVEPPEPNSRCTIM
jgi:Ras-related protein Rab-1A